MAWLLLGAIMLAGALLWARTQVKAPPMSLARTSLQTDAQPISDVLLPMLTSNADVRPVVQPLAREPRPATIAAALRQEFETSRDLFSYAQRLAPQVRRGEADALWLLSKVVDYCSEYANNRAGYARDTEVMARLRVPASMLRARARIAERCARFSQADGLLPAVVWQLRVHAAEQGSVAAEAALAAKGEPVKSKSGYVRDLAERVVESQDPDAYRAMSTAVANGSVQTDEVLDARTTAAKAVADAPQPREASSNGIPLQQESSSTPQLDALAWQLAACRLGGQCGADSTLMTSYCVNGGICSQRPDQDFETFVYDAAIPRQGADVVRRMVDALVDEEHTGEPE